MITFYRDISTGICVASTGDSVINTGISTASTGNFVAITGICAT
jgi:hypothetical protein